MLAEFKHFIEREALFGTDKTILLAVSGGIDSVVMAELFHRAGYKFAIAHCNFGLRGAESAQDETFVREAALRYNVPYHVKHFKTREYAGFNKISVQMAARELRYAWFEELLQTQEYDLLATAHHLDDQIETFFINLLRGTGLSGLHGILPGRDRVVHPLMFAFRREIEEFANEEALPYREDSSNKSNKYLRNKIRLDLFPLLHEINPEFRKTITDTIENLRDSEELLSHHLVVVEKELIRYEANTLRIDLEKLKAYTPLDGYLYELLKPYGFNYPVIPEIIQAMDDIPGKKFYSQTHRVIKDRKELLITPYEPGNDDQVSGTIRREDKQLGKPLNLRISEVPYDASMDLQVNRNTALFDADKLKYPLFLRKWREGDTFVPFGMTRNKKLSDFFIDAKFSIVEKENAWLLVSDRDIIWVVGHRAGNLFRVEPDTKSVLKIELLD